MGLIQVLPVLLLFLSAARRTAGALNTSGGSCKTKCGSIDIPYPFGIGDGCYAAEYGNFGVSCDETSNPPKPMIMSDPPLEIRSINEFGQLFVNARVAYQCFAENGASTTRSFSWNLSALPYTISGNSNKFVVVGCDIQATLRFKEGVTGCLAYCADPIAAPTRRCSGLGCCVSEFPAGLKAVTVTISSPSNYTNFRGLNRCGYASLKNGYSFDFNPSDLYSAKLANMDVFTALEWSIGSQTCDQVKRNSAGRSACVSEGSECINKQEGGYICRCSSGFRGNPYIKGGCRGSYAAEYVRTSLLGVDIQPIWLILGASSFVFLLMVGSCCLCMVYQRRKIIKHRKHVDELKKKMFEQNGGIVLQEFISSQPGNTFKLFSEAELAKASDGFKDDQIIGRGGHGVVYKGRLECGTLVAIKKSRILNERESKEFAREIAILSQINHVNIVKILGCCLEVEIPMLVYEFVSGGTLFNLIHRRRSGEPISLATRLQIATEVCEALAYLHSYASPPIFHKDVKTSNILLDVCRQAKISDFGASAVAPADQAEVATVVQGTCGYLDPEYLQTYQFTEKSDVYSFGVVLVELMTGRKPFQAQDVNDYRGLAATFVSLFKTNGLAQILDAEVLHEKEKIGYLTELACRCLSVKGVDRPTMKEVTLALHSIGKMPWRVPGSSSRECEGDGSLSGAALSRTSVDTSITQTSVDIETGTRASGDVSYGSSSICTSIIGR